MRSRFLTVMGLAACLTTLSSCSSKVASPGSGRGTAPPTGEVSPSGRPLSAWPLPGAVGPDGALYVTDCENARIYRMDPSGTMTTFAGAGPGFSGDGGPALKARFGCPYGLAFDSKGDLYVADHLNTRIRMIDPSGIVTTVAGGGTLLQSEIGSGKPATQAKLFTPTGIAVDRYDNVYFTQRDSGVVSKIDTNGILTTVAGTGTAGALGDGGLATHATLDQPEDIEFDKAGNLYIADSAHNRIRMVDANGIITTIAGTGKNGTSGDGGPAIAANLNNPDYLLFDAKGDLYFNDDTGARVRMIDMHGIVTEIAGDGTKGCAGLNGGSATAAEIHFPAELATDEHGELLVISWPCGVLRVNHKGRINLVAKIPGT